MNLNFEWREGQGEYQRVSQNDFITKVTDYLSKKFMTDEAETVFEVQHIIKNIYGCLQNRALDNLYQFWRAELLMLTDYKGNAYRGETIQ